MNNARLRILHIGETTELQVAIDGQLWIMSFVDFEDATEFMRLSGWATLEQMAGLSQDSPHLLWEREINTKPAFLSLIGFYLNGYRPEDWFARSLKPTT